MSVQAYLAPINYEDLSCCDAADWMLVRELLIRHAQSNWIRGLGFAGNSNQTNREQNVLRKVDGMCDLYHLNCSVFAARKLDTCDALFPVSHKPH